MNDWHNHVNGNCPGKAVFFYSQVNKLGVGNLSNVTVNLYTVNILLFANLRGMLLHLQIIWEWKYDLIIAFLF